MKKIMMLFLVLVFVLNLTSVFAAIPYDNFRCDFECVDEGNASGFLVINYDKSEDSINVVANCKGLSDPENCLLYVYGRSCMMLIGGYMNDKGDLRYEYIEDSTQKEMLLKILSEDYVVARVFQKITVGNYTYFEYVLEGELIERSSKRVRID